MTALLVAAALFAFPAVFQTPEVAALEDFTEKMRQETSPVTDEERMALYDQSAYYYLTAAGSADRVLEEETEKLTSYSKEQLASLKNAHQQRVARGTKKINRQKLTAKEKKNKLQKMRSASYKKYLKDASLLNQEVSEKVSELEEAHFDAQAWIYDLQMEALSYIDLRPSAL